MLVNLMPPPVADEIRLREPVIVVSPAAAEPGFLVVHPRYRDWLNRCGLTSSRAVLALPGEIVSGHPNRHVVQVTVKSGGGTRTLFLKREHAVGRRERRRNDRAGFGRVSRSEREAKVLERLEKAGLPGPHWVAYGEDGRGRAFLLVDELTGYRELRELLSGSLLPADRRALATRVGESLADLHAAGFGTPDLSAKHVFVRPGSFSTTVLDWQSAKPGEVDTVESLAALHASLVEGLASPRERLRALRAYLRRITPAASLSTIARSLHSQAQSLLTRSSVREQRQPNAGVGQRLVWLADEAVCAVPDVAKHWPRPAVCSPYYADAVEDGERLGIRLADDRPATLLRFRTRDFVGRIAALVRGKAWRSPAAKLSRLLFHLQKAGVPVPPLYAFGQRLGRVRTADSFLAYGLPPGAVTLDAWLARSDADAADLLAEFGKLMRAVHDADCTLGSAADAVYVAATAGPPKLLLDPTRGAVLGRPLSASQRVRDLAAVLRSFRRPLPAADDRRVRDGYAAGVFEPRLLRRVVVSS